jgi:hypothetical protein
VTLKFINRPAGQPILERYPLLALNPQVAFSGVICPAASTKWASAFSVGCGSEALLLLVFAVPTVAAMALFAFPTSKEQGLS